MKRTERRHLKDNELAVLATNAKDWWNERRRELTMTVVVGGVVAAAVIGWFGWRGMVQSRAHGLLAEAMAVDDAPVGAPQNPDAKELRFYNEREKLQAALTKYKVVADAYPSSDAGLFARYRQAAIWLALDSPTEAAKAYQEVVDRDGNGLYGQMARLGLAEAQARSGQFDAAIKTFKDLSERKDGPLPVDGVLMHLGRTYLEAGKRAEAQQAFNRLVEEFPNSPFASDARRELDNLKKT